jgi:hypothetical protein
VGDAGGSSSSGTVALRTGAAEGAAAFAGGSSSSPPPSRDERKPAEEVSEVFAPLAGVGSSGSSAAAEALEGRVVGDGGAGSSTSCRMRRAGISTALRRVEPCLGLGMVWRPLGIGDVDLGISDEVMWGSGFGVRCGERQGNWED